MATSRVRVVFQRVMQSSSPSAPRVPRDFSLPTTGGVWRMTPGVYPGIKLEHAFNVIGANLWPLMASESRWWWGPSPERCVWASCASAEFLKRLGFRCEVVSGVLGVALLGDTAGPDGLSIGAPDPHTGHPGAHNVVVVNEGKRRWVLETSLWQAHRARFGPLPDVLLTEVYNLAPGQNGGFREWASIVRGKLLTVVVDARLGGALALGWALIPRRTAWRGAPDARPERAKAVADGLMDMLKVTPEPEPFVEPALGSPAWTPPETKRAF